MNFTLFWLISLSARSWNIFCTKFLASSRFNSSFREPGSTLLRNCAACRRGWILSRHRIRSITSQGRLHLWYPITIYFCLVCFHGELKLGCLQLFCPTQTQDVCFTVIYCTLGLMCLCSIQLIRSQRFLSLLASAICMPNHSYGAISATSISWQLRLWSLFLL